MKNTVFVLILLLTLAYSDNEIEVAERELAHIQVDEWGVLTLSNSTSVFSSVPGTSFSEPDITELPANNGGVLLRAPVLYFHGPAFSGTVTVKTNNGSIFDIYPSVVNTERNHNRVTWTVDFSYADINEYPALNSIAPGEWNYDLWRDVPALSISRDDGWNDKFLYYETAPATTDFLPYRPGMESLCDEYMNIKALVIRRLDDGIYFYQCTLRDIVYGGDVKYLDMNPDDILRVLYEWSLGIIELEEVDALWNTWSSWMLREYIYEPGFEESLVLYMIPENLTEKLSTISVVPDHPGYTVDIKRYLIVAMPL